MINKMNVNAANKSLANEIIIVNQEVSISTNSNILFILRKCDDWKSVFN